MLSEDEIRELYRLLDYAAERMGYAYVARKLEISVDDVHAFWNRRGDWTEDLAGRMPAMLEHMAGLGMAPGPPPAGPENGGDPPPAETENETAAETTASTAPQAPTPEEADRGFLPTAPTGSPDGIRGRNEAAAQPSGYFFGQLMHAYRRTAPASEAMEGGAAAKDRELFLRILQATGLLGYGRSVTDEPITPDQEMELLDDQAAYIRFNADPDLADAVRSRLQDAYDRDIWE